MSTFASQCPVFLASLAARRKKPKPSTLEKFDSICHCHILPRIGDCDLGTFDNGAMKRFADDLCASELSARSVRQIVLVTKMVIGSAIDENGNLLYSKTWNHDFLDLPPISTDAPGAATAQEIEKVLREHKDKRVAVLVGLLAGTGLRIGEALALRISDDGTHSCLSDGALFIRTALWRGRENDSPKTNAGKRTIFLCSDIEAMLRAFIGERKVGVLFRSRTGNFLSERVARAGLPWGFHSLRRYRVSHCRMMRASEDWLRQCVGHANRGITDSYFRMDPEFARKESTRVGLGFSLSALTERLLSTTSPRDARAECLRAGIGFEIPARLGGVS
jgi:site-specific recombinase XerD